MPLVINGEVLPDVLLEQEFDGIKAHYERMGAMSCCGRDEEFRGYARENLIARVLINQEAERQYPEIPEEEVRAGLERLIEAEGGRAAFFAHAGLREEDEETARREIATGLRVDRLMTELWGPEDTAEDAERVWYEAHRQDFPRPEEVHALHLFKQVEKVEDREAVYDLLRGLRREARGEGRDFASMALEHTDKEDKQVDLGFFRRGEFMEEFDRIVFSLEEGEVSPVFPSHWGFHLVKIVARRPSVPWPFETVRNQVRAAMVAEHRSRVTRELVDRLKAAAEISG